MTNLVALGSARRGIVTDEGDICISFFAIDGKKFQHKIGENAKIGLP